MAASTVAQRKRMLLKLLNEDEVRRIVLYGESGIGKTWTAREISNFARKRGLIDIVLWVYMNRKNDSDTLRDSLAYQLSLLSTTGGSEVEGDNEQLEKEESQGHSQQEMSRVVDGKKLLLVLDDEGNKMNEQEVMSALETLLKLNQQNYKVLITKRDILSSDISKDDENSRIEVKPMSKEESLSLLRGRVGTEAFKVRETAALAEKFVEKTKNVPAAIILMAKAFSYFVQQDSGVHILERSLEEASENYSITDLLRSGYDLLPNSVLFDCCWGGSHFLHHCGRIHYNELIVYWIMEGYLGHVGLMEKAYERGHFVLMELIDCQILKRVEPDYVMMEGPTLNLVDVVMERARVNRDDCYRHGFCGTASLGLGSVFGDSKWEGLGRVTKMDGVIKTLQNGKQGNKMSTLLLDGSSLTREFPCDFFESHQDLQVVGVFSPTLNTLPPSSSMVHSLYMFVLRGCHFMENIEQIVHFQKLTVLEISGPSSLTTIPDEFFENIPRLQSLNLSFLQIDDLPSSLYDLSELRWLILRGCSRLKSLQSLKKCKNLAVLDLSGATSLEKIQDKNFLQNQELQMLNFSKTKIKCIPLVNSLKKLTHLLLSQCLELERLRGINGVTSLQVLDLSNASKFNEFHDQSLDSIVGFKILDLSGTAIDHLPSKIGNPRHLFLRGCTRLEDLSCIETLKDLELIDISKLRLKTLPSLSHLHNLRSLSVSCSKLVKLPDLSNLKLLEVLDLSGCSDLEVLQDDTFEHMPCLWKLDLSEIPINCSLSSLSQLTNLRHLLLSRCTGLTALPPLGALSKLEELSLCGISCLRDTEADFLEKMSHLQILDLSETLLQKLPRMVNLKNLRQLYLRGCPGLKTVPDLETLTKLEVLDLSGTAVRPLESLNDFINLRQFLPGDFLVPEEILRPETDPSDGAAQELPHGVSEWTQLEKLDLPNIIEGQDQCGWHICGLPSGTVGKNYNRPLASSSSNFLQLLKSNPSLWKTRFQKFHFCVQPTEEQDRKEVVPFRRDFTFRDIYFKSRQFFDFEEQGSLEIQGFHHPPKGICDVISHVEFVFLTENAFDGWLSCLGASNFKVLKGCWIETCREMKTAFHEKGVEEEEKLGDLEVLWVSNCVNLNILYHGNWQSDTFQNLKRLYLDCCPKLSFVFSSSQIPINLEVLHIKFCDNLECVFEEASPLPKLPYLDTLFLWELPELKSIGCALPSLQTRKVWQCPNLAEFEENVKLQRSLVA